MAQGADGIAQKLQIVKAVTDVSELDAGFRNCQYRLTQLMALRVTDMNPAVYHFQRSPSLPVYQGCPGLVGDEGVAGGNHWGGYRM